MEGGIPRPVDLQLDERGAARRVLPSLVFVAEDGWHVGAAADHMARTRPRRLVRAPKLLLGAGLGPDGGVWDVIDDNFDCELSVVDVCAAIIRAAYERACGRIGEEPVHVRVTHPAVWEDDRVRIEYLRKAIVKAGIEGASLLTEADAAARAAAVLAPTTAPEPDSRELVFDLGGGTCDVALLRRTDTGASLEHAAGLEDVGGEEFYRRLLALLATKVGELSAAAKQALEPRDRIGDDEPLWQVFARHAREEVVRAKEKLADVDAVTLAVDLPSAAGGEGDVFEMQLDRAALARCIAVPVERVRELTDAALKVAGVNPSALARVLLTGGSTRLPTIASSLHKLVGNEVPLEQLEKQIVSLGATLDWQAVSPARRSRRVWDPALSPFESYHEATPRPAAEASA
jgi:molecular chaperone DnaK (HSP70)